MSAGVSSLTAAELRTAFDSSFSRAVEPPRPDVEDFLAIRAGSHDLAVRRRELAAVMRCPPFIPAPAGNAALCGLAGVRGAVVAVYSIAALTGASEHRNAGEWIVLSGADRSAAFSFDEIAGFARLSSEEIHSARAVTDERIEAGEVTEIVQIDGTSRAVISIARLLETIRRSAQAAAD